MKSPVAMRILIAVIACAGFVFVFLQSNAADIRISRTGKEILGLWQDCMVNKMAIHRDKADDTWDNINHISDSCSGILRESFDIEVFNNKDEAKYHIMPDPSVTQTTHLTIGVGNDIDAETALKEKLENKVEMFGADPITDINEDLFSSIGSYFPFAVGAKAGVSQASVLVNKQYVTKTVVHIDMLYFLQHVVRRKFFDGLWLDAEGAEYELLPYFYKGALLEQNDITICQINMEIHYPDDAKKKQAHDFYYRIIDDGRYAIYQALNVSHHRVYLINLENSACLARYKRI